MKRTIHDSFAKEWMQELLADFGTVEVEHEVSGEVRTIDLVFSPDPTAQSDRHALGLLGKMIDSPCLIEAFRNAVPEWEVCNCRVKLFEFLEELRRRAKQKQQTIQKSDRPFLWIVTPTFSANLQAEFCVRQKPGWSEGVYFLPNPDRTAIVAVHQLPKTLETIWLRLLGKGKIQAGAIAELIALPLGHPHRQETMSHLATLQINFKALQNKTKEIREVIMSLSVVYEQWRTETLDQGRQEGRQEEKRSLAVKLLQSGSTIDFVAQITGYRLEEIQMLQVELGRS